MKPNNTLESIHGHEVMHHIQANGPISHGALSQALHLKYGEHARYHTCAAEGMNLGELLEFLLIRSKINETPAGFVMGSSTEICDHQ